MKRKVLHIITRLDAGGSTTNTLETCARLNKDKYDVSLISGKTYDFDGSIDLFIKKYNISCLFFNDLIRNINFFKDIKVFFQLYIFIRQNNFDIVHTHSSKAGIIGRWAAWFAGVKYIVHTPHGHVFYGYFNKFISGIFIMVERFTARITNKIITLTDIGKNEHIQYKIAQADKFMTIYSGINLEQFKPDLRVSAQYREIWGIHPDEILFGTVARLDPIKGNECIIEAMHKVIEDIPSAKLIFIGDGTQRKVLEKQSIMLNLDKHIIFTEHQTDIKNHIGMFDIFVLASLNEGMGRVILEAMACSKPVIASRVGGIPELVKENQNGLLFPSGDSDALAAAMVQLAEDTQQQEKFGCTGKKFATEKFSLDKMLKDIEKLYDEVKK
ncbi:hypothetical protein MNBD_UNCLBAC01-2029 [hydrothermal vent metagenome]|uniref:Glycosyltransferase family 1 protein n=1 Tax=hydrothermal vent metagenome TaxID=652676 RepID=A0A3B1D7M6_9ZZZZ